MMFFSIFLHISLVLTFKILTYFLSSCSLTSINWISFSNLNCWNSLIFFFYSQNEIIFHLGLNFNLNFFSLFVFFLIWSFLIYMCVVIAPMHVYTESSLMEPFLENYYEICSGAWWSTKLGCQNTCTLTPNLWSH